MYFQEPCAIMENKLFILPRRFISGVCVSQKKVYVYTLLFLMTFLRLIMIARVKGYVELNQYKEL